MAIVTTGAEIHGLDGFEEEPPSLTVPPDGDVDVMARAWGVSTINLDGDARVLVSDGTRTFLHSEGDPAIAATVLARAIELAREKSSAAAGYLAELLEQVGAEPLADEEEPEDEPVEDEPEVKELADAA